MTEEEKNKENSKPDSTSPQDEVERLSDDDLEGLAGGAGRPGGKPKT